jgi:release factor glutamine methyltransferase
MAAELNAAFREQGRDGDAGLDARILLAHVMKRGANDLALLDDQAIDETAERLALTLLERRIRGEPVARIVGSKEFWGLDFIVSKDTLVPRPDTETVVEAALAIVRRDAPISILDLGTGSGAILLALLSELPQARGVGTDMSGGAIDVARSNANHLGLGERVSFVASDWASAIDARFDLVVSNPPYIATAAIATLMVDVRDFDPHLALDGGADGLAAYRTILEELPRLLSSEAVTLLEIGFDQADALRNLSAAAGFQSRLHFDLGGMPRVVELRGRIG